MKIERKKIFNEKGERGTQRMIGGNTTNLREWNRIKYQWANELRVLMLSKFWLPNEVGLTKDKSQFPTLTKGERRAFDKTIAFLNFLDSIQCENLPRITDYITAPEVCSCLNIQAAFEEIHAQSYSHILDTVTEEVTRELIYDEWRHDSHLLKRNKFIANLYQEFSDNPNDSNFVKVCMANYLLESLYFYSGFTLFYTLARQGKMTGTASLIKLIQRDEKIHVVLFQNILNETRKENPELFTKDFIEELRDMARTAAEHEIEWGIYVTNDDILGLNDDLISKYIKYLANLRMRSIGLEILYPEQTVHPMKWVDDFSDLNTNKVDFFEQKVVNYDKKSLSMDDL